MTAIFEGMCNDEGRIYSGIYSSPKINILRNFTQ